MRTLLTIVLAAAIAPHGQAAVSTKTIATDLHVPWGIAFLPKGDALVAERTTGKILRVPKNGGTPKPWKTLSGVDTGAGEGGLLGLAISPRYKKDHLVYAYYTSKDDNRIVRFTRRGAQKTVLTGLARATFHNGGRIAFGPDGKLYATVGDAGDTSRAQDKTSLNGKILRVNPSGSVPKGNPFDSPVWSMGHRNPQGLAWDRKGRLWAPEFGQNTTDEVNLIEPGKNYGWPDVEGNGDTEGGKYTNPKVTWTPTSTASPSGAAIVGNTLYVGALQAHGVFKIALSGTTAGKPALLYDNTYGRVRTVVKAPGGGLWIATSNTDGRGDPQPKDDKIIRVRG